MGVKAHRACCQIDFGWYIWWKWTVASITQYFDAEKWKEEKISVFLVFGSLKSVKNCGHSIILTLEIILTTEPSWNWGVAPPDKYSTLWIGTWGNVMFWGFY